MQKTILLLVLIAFIGCSVFASLTNNPPQFSAFSLLPKETLQVDVLGLNPPKHIQASYYKQMAAMKENAPWFREFIRTNVSTAPGPRPFNTNFGLTEAEHKEFLSYKPRFVKVTNSRLNVSKCEDDSITFQGRGSIAEMVDVKIDCKNMSVTTPFGILSSNTLEFADAPAGAMDAWSGYRWILDDGNRQKGRAMHVEFSLGKLTNTNQVFINYSVRIRDSFEEQHRANIEIVILYPCPEDNNQSK